MPTAMVPTRRRSWSRCAARCTRPCGHSAISRRITADDRPLAYVDATELNLSVDGGILRLDAVLPLAAPVDPRTARIALQLMDPTYYVALDLAEVDPVRLTGDVPDGCSSTVEPPRDGDDPGTDAQRQSRQQRRPRPELRDGRCGHHPRGLLLTRRARVVAAVLAVVLAMAAMQLAQAASLSSLAGGGWWTELVHVGQPASPTRSGVAGTAGR